MILEAISLSFLRGIQRGLSQDPSLKRPEFSSKRSRICGSLDLYNPLEKGCDPFKTVLSAPFPMASRRSLF